jgi:DNA-binding NtrC family response regulator
MASILVVDDEVAICDALTLLLEHAGHQVHRAGSGRQALDTFGQQQVDAVLLDVALPDVSGINLLTKLQEHDPLLPCVFITAFGSVRSAVEAIRAGGFDYVVKPFDNHELLRTLDRALGIRRLKGQVKELENDLKSRSEFSGIVGDSGAMRGVLRILSRAAGTDATVLITGESGTGKELVARSLHRQSRRTNGPFVPVNCAAIPASLAESEFFGNERGAYTDAREAREGLFERSHGGTLFLDEIGELSSDIQAKLLRVLQDREVTRLGGRQPRKVDVRIVAATNLELRRTATAGGFREDLFWRLNQFPLHLPPLRERRDDLPALVSALIDRLNAELGMTVTGISSAAALMFQRYGWPGNVRELENVLRYAMIVTDHTVLEVEHFPSLATIGSGSEPPVNSVVGSLSEIVARATARIERGAIEAALKTHQGNRTATAAALGISRRTLFNKLQQWRLIAADAEDQETG